MRATQAALAAAVLGAAVARAATAQPASAEAVGRVRLTLAGGVTVPASDAVLWIEGVLSAAPRTSLQPPAVASRSKRFDPHVLVVTKGAPVAFPNVDPIFHNVFSRTPGSEFDLGLYRRGAYRTFAFKSPGLVRLYCNIHAEMAAYVMVVNPEDAFAVTAADGSFRLAGLPAGRHVVKVWHEQGGQKEVPVDFAAGVPSPLDVALDASAYRALPHKNKRGKDYPPATSGVDRY